MVSTFNGNHLCNYSRNINIFASLHYPQFSLTDLLKDSLISFGEISSRFFWGLSKNGRSFLDSHYSAYGINGYTALDKLPSTTAKIFKSIGIGLMAGKNFIVYKVSTGVASAVGTWTGAKLGASLGAGVGWVIDEFGDVIIGWVVGWFD